MIFTIKLDSKTQEYFKGRELHSAHCFGGSEQIDAELNNAAIYPPLLVIIGVSSIEDLNILTLESWTKHDPYFYICYQETSFINLLFEKRIKSMNKFLGLLPAKEIESIPFLIKELQWSGMFQSYMLIEKSQKLRDAFVHKFEEVEKDVGHMIRNLEDQLHLTRAAKKKAENRRRVVQGPVIFEYRYGVGYESGSEYAEFIVKGSDIWWINFSTKSYSNSAIFLKFLEKLKKCIIQDQQRSFEVGDAADLLIQDLKLNLDQNQFYFAHVRPAKNVISVARHGKGYQLLSTEPLDPLIVEKKSDKNINSSYELSKLSISKSDQMILVSPGYFDNILNQSKKSFVADFVKENLIKFKEDILDEMMLFLDKRGGQDFYNYDTSLVYLEIRPHGIQTTS
jgi:hypothetical protein